MATRAGPQPRACVARAPTRSNKRAKACSTSSVSERLSHVVMRRDASPGKGTGRLASQPSRPTARPSRRSGTRGLRSRGNVKPAAPSSRRMAWIRKKTPIGPAAIRRASVISVARQRPSEGCGRWAALCCSSPAGGRPKRKRLHTGSTGRQPWPSGSHSAFDRIPKQPHSGSSERPLQDSESHDYDDQTRRSIRIVIIESNQSSSRRESEWKRWAATRSRRTRSNSSIETEQGKLRRPWEIRGRQERQRASQDKPSETSRFGIRHQKASKKASRNGPGDRAKPVGSTSRTTIRVVRAVRADTSKKAGSTAQAARRQTANNRTSRRAASRASRSRFELESRRPLAPSEV